MQGGEQRGDDEEDTQRKGLPALQVKQSKREVERQIHDDDEARVDTALHCQTYRAQATGMRLERIALRAVQHHVHHACVQGVYQCDDGEVDEAGESLKWMLA